MVRNGIIMAFDEWNNQGGVMGHRLTWVDYDTGCDFAAGQQAAQQALKDGANFMIGPLCSAAAIGAAHIITSSQAILIAPAATHPLVTVDSQSRQRPTVFRVALAWPQQAQAAANFAINSLSGHRAAILFDPADDYALTLAHAFAQQFTHLGGQIVYQAAYTPTDNDFDSFWQAISQAGVEVLYLPASANVANQVATQIKQAGLADKLTLLGSDSWDSQVLDVATTSGSYFMPHFFGQDNRPETRQWANAYKATYAIEPTSLAALGYESANLLAQAVQQAGKVEVKAIAQTLAQGRFQGITGPISFDQQHNSLKPIPVVQLKDGAITFVTYVTPDR
jgi:branched-chain amino acid transport system substrate-binding protein